MRHTKRTLSQQDKEMLSNSIEHAHWCLSDWMEIKTLDLLRDKLLSSDLEETWKSLIDCKKDFSALADYTVAAMDSWYRYEFVSKPTLHDKKVIFRRIDKTLEKLLILIKESHSKEDISMKSNKSIFDLFESHWFPVPYDGNFGSMPRFYYPFQLDNWLKTVQEVVKDFAINPPCHPLLSAKRSDSGLSAFYTNSLCVITTEKFNRPCYEEIATIANTILDVNKDNPITGELVRVNFNNHSDRNNIRDRKITEKNI